jgi:hypothetical protein
MLELLIFKSSDWFADDGIGQEIGKEHQLVEFDSIEVWIGGTLLANVQN